MGIAVMMGFRNNDVNIAEVLYVITQFRQVPVDIGITQGGRPHIHAAAVRTQVHGYTDDRNFGHINIVPSKNLFRDLAGKACAGKESSLERARDRKSTRRRARYPYRSPRVAPRRSA